MKRCALLMNTEWMFFFFQTLHRMPTFTEGDMQLFFPKEEKDAEVPVCVDRALLSLFCPKFGESTFHNIFLVVSHF